MKAIFKYNDILKNILELSKMNIESAVLECRPDGMRVEAMDSSHVSLMSFYFNNEELFEEYVAAGEKIGFLFENMFKILKIASKNDTLIFEHESGDNNMKIQIKNSDKQWVFNLLLIEMDFDELTVPPPQSGLILRIDTDDLSNHLKILSEFADNIKISYEGGTISLSASINDSPEPVAQVSLNSKCKWYSDSSEHGSTLQDILNDKIMDCDIDVNSLDLTFASKYLFQYCTGKKVAKQIVLLLVDNCPLTIGYGIGEKSNLVFFLAPKMKED